MGVLPYPAQLAENTLSNWVRTAKAWADGIHLQARMEDSVECVLVIIGVTEGGDKELLTIEGGHRESKESWLTVLKDLQNRGLTKAPKLAVGDGTLGFWEH